MKNLPRAFAPVALAAIATAASVRGAAADEPVLERDVPRAPTESEQIHPNPLPMSLEAGSPDLAPRPLELVRLPAGVGDHGSSYTDAGRPGAEPTELEREKLAMARAAVARARANGAMWLGSVDDDVVPPSPGDLARIKDQRLRALPPAELAPDPGAGVGDVPSVQEVGAPGLTPYEIAKRDGLNPEPPRADENPVSVPPDAVGDGAPARAPESSAREEGERHD